MFFVVASSFDFRLPADDPRFQRGFLFFKAALGVMQNHGRPAYVIPHAEWKGQNPPWPSSGRADHQEPIMAGWIARTPYDF
jgi:hypothetical protein